MKRTPHRNPGFISAQVRSIDTITRISFSVLRIIARIITPILGSISDHTTHRSPTPEPFTVVTVMVVVIVIVMVIMAAVIVAALVVAATVMTPTVTAAMAVRYGDRSALQNT
jgi:MFS-type transporter involved in bile tolerance (Atg22 family)